MNEKGFTLVELLAVILVIALIATFAIPQVLNQFSNYSEQLTKNQEKMIVEAARAYVELNHGTYSAKKDSCIALKTLVDAELLNEDFVKEALGDSYNTTKKIKVKYDKKRYDIKLENGECK